MKPAIGLLTLAVALVWAATAHAEALTSVYLPPEHYDYPYTGRLIIKHARDEQDAQKLCHPAVFGSTGALACARRDSYSCQIVIVAEEVIKSRGFSPESVMRHEIGHCNGWGTNHWGARRRWQDWGAGDPAAKADTPTDDDLVLNAASRYDDFASSVVNKTVAEAASSLAPAESVKFIEAAKSIGLEPKSQLPALILSNTDLAAPLARAVGIGTGLTDEQWRRAHHIAFYAAKARQAENARTGPQPQQAQPAPPVPNDVNPNSASERADAPL